MITAFLKRSVFQGKSLILDKVSRLFGIGEQKESLSKVKPHIVLFEGWRQGLYGILLFPLTAFVPVYTTDSTDCVFGGTHKPFVKFRRIEIKMPKETGTRLRRTTEVLVEGPIRPRPLFWIIDINQLYPEIYVALLSNTLTFLTSLASLGCVWARRPVGNPFICTNTPSFSMLRQCLALRHRQCSLGSKELVCNPHSPSYRRLTSIVPLEIPQPSVCNPHFPERRSVC
jgi:hypothetical protein